MSFNIRIIGERINPGFKSTKALFDNSDIPGIQALAVKQAEAGASWLNVNIGARALTDTEWMATVIRAIQEVTTVPLSFDFPSKKVQEACLQAYDPAKAQGALPLVNSITEHRWDLMELYGPYRFKVILMASERVEAVNGAMIAKGNKSADEIYGTARRCALRLMNDYGMPADDIIVDMSVSAIIADTEGLNRSTVEAIRLIGQDPALKGVHMMGGLSNIGQQLPPKAVDGSDLKHALECAFLTLTVPLGFDTVLGTPWRGYEVLPADHYVLATYQNFLQQTGSNALRAVRKFYKA
ncbi:MAG TPA: dihydropteroate synthase [Burkholderiaceae bacterium]|uniref:dihydropteroate synthase n=1 Tax=Piscinibacter sp. TaxID=1903157 RepID=UPI002BF4F7A9|nr:dihydropteroate synthase [Burkholderiaceae bacterium]HNK52485.1 dihydropteroate synthase [Ottowia sp.]HNL42015.1 dihydropteroate synthase [Ottowia sp.]HNN33337.1 dihydropteroate synthase [Ottowia sp.]